MHLFLEGLVVELMAVSRKEPWTETILIKTSLILARIPQSVVSSCAIKNKSVASHLVERERDG